MQSGIVQRLRDAAEDHRVDPGGTPEVTVHLVDGRSYTGTVLAVEDGAAYLDLTRCGADATRSDTLVLEATVIDLTTIVAAT